MTSDMLDEPMAEEHDPTGLRPTLIVLTALAAAAHIWAVRSGVHHKIEMRSAMLLIATAPAAGLALWGRRSLGALRISIALAVMTYFVIQGRIDLGGMAASFGHWPWIVAGLVLCFNMPLIGAWRWRHLLAAHDIHMSFAQSLRLTCVGFFFNICLPGATGGDIFRACAIGRSAEKKGLAVTSVVVDRVSGLGALAPLCGAAILLNFGLLQEQPDLGRIAWVMVGLIAAAVMTLVVIFHARTAEWLRRSKIAAWQMPGRSGLGQAYRAVEAFRDARGAILAAIAVSILSHIFTATGAWCFAQALGFDALPLRAYLLLVPLGLAVNAIPITPGGVGQGQAAFSYLFAIALPTVAVAGSVGASVMTFIHVAMFIMAAVGALVYASGQHKLHEAQVGQKLATGPREPDSIPEPAP